MIDGSSDAIVGIGLVFRRARWLLASGLTFLAGVLPVLGLTPFQFESYSLIADHYLYTAMIGPAFALAFVLARISRVKAAGPMCAAVLLALGVRSFAQTAYWTDTPTVFEHNLAVNPASNATYENLAAWDLMHNQFDKSVQEARQAIALDRSRTQPCVTLSAALARLGKVNDVD